MTEKSPDEVGKDGRKAVPMAGGGAVNAGPAQEALTSEGPVREHQVLDGYDQKTTAWLFSAGHEPRRIDPAELDEVLSHDENLVWINLPGFTEAQLRKLAPDLGLHRDEVHAALSRWQRPHLAVHDGHFSVSVTVARIDTTSYRVMAGELDLSVGDNYLLSLHQLPLPFADQIVMRARTSPDLVRLDSAYMLYIILDELLAYYEDLYEEVQDEVERMEERALTDTSETFLEDLLKVKHFVSALSRLAEQHRQVFGAFLRPDFRFVHGEEVEVYFRDLEVRLSRLTDTLDSAKDSVNGAFDIYVSHVADRTNQIIKVLTIVSTILLPVTLIVTLFSTAFHGIPLYGTAGFIGMIVTTFAVTAVILFAFHQRGWLF